jgi:plastocyanin
MRKIMPLLLVAVAVIAGCSSDSKTSTSASTSSSSSASAASAPVSLPGQTNDKGTGDATSGTLELEADDFYFSPTFVKVTPGASVKVKLENEGSVQHTFTSTALGVDQVVDPGKDVEVTVTVPSSGLPAEFHCRFHQGQGMQGALFDVAGSAAGSGTPAGSTSSSSSDAGYYN